MNYRTSTMQKSNNWRAPSDGSVAHKLLSIELEHHHETQSLRREIKRLRAEVGLMARLRNFHKAETDRLAEILRKLPPPIVPTRQTTKVATPSNLQNDTTVQERGRPRERAGNGSNKSTSCEDGKKKTSEKGKDKEEDTPMTEGPNHTIGKTRNDTSSTRPKVLETTTPPKISVPTYSRSGSRQRAVSVVSALRMTRTTTSSPGPQKKSEVTTATKIRRGGKEKTRKATKIVEKEINAKDQEEWKQIAMHLEDELVQEVLDTKCIEELKGKMNKITTKWKIVDYEVVRMF